jgi:hypothetical protein
MHIPVDVLEELAEFTGNFWSSWDQEPHIAAAIRAYMKPAPPVVEAATRSDIGYQWKQVFLPAGTRLRASFGRQPYFASVEGGEIQSDGQSISPSSFANLRGSGNRNAWKAVWLRFPGSPQWVLADACRALQKAATARLFSADADANANATTSQPQQTPSPRSAASVATTATAATTATTATAATAAPTRAVGTATPKTTATAATTAPGKKKSRRGRRHKRSHNA